MKNQLNKLQFPGRYQQHQLPLPVQAQLRAWSGLEVQAILTSRQLKCFVDAPSDVVATMRTTVVRVGGEWHYVDFCRQLAGCKRRLRLPLNASLVVTFFGDKPDDSQPAPEVQPVPKPVPHEPSTQVQVHTYLQRLHVGLGHPGAAEFIQHLRDAGAAPWLIRQAEQFECAVCQSLPHQQLTVSWEAPNTVVLTP